MMLSEKRTQEIRDRAKVDAMKFAQEWPGVPLDPVATDWDAIAFVEALHPLAITPEEYSQAWDVYSEALVHETRVLATPVVVLVTGAPLYLATATEEACEDIESMCAVIAGEALTARAEAKCDGTSCGFVHWLALYYQAAHGKSLQLVRP